MAFGGWIGSLFGGPLGAILGAALGHQIEKKLTSARQSKRPVGYADMSARRQSMVFCASVAAMLAKMAKADGVVSRSEIAQVEAAFRRLGFPPSAREYAVSVFRKAKDDAHSIYEYAEEFAVVVESTEIRELFYEILWDVAGADGSFSREELLILQRMPRALRIRIDWYAFFASERIAGFRSRSETRTDPLAEAYALLGASAGDTNDELKRKYRELAKRNHPDTLRAQGLPEAMVGKATERMSRINSAWKEIRAARGI